MTRKIHDPVHQMKDFFKDESMKRIIPNNPYNILWVIENFIADKESYLATIKDAQQCITNNKLCYTHSCGLNAKLIADDVVIKRVKELKHNHHVDIDLLSCKAIRMRSVSLIKALFEMGMNPNAIDQSNTMPPLFIAVGRKNQKIINAYWDNEKTNREVVDSEGNNIAHIAIKYSNWLLLRKIYNEQPQLLLAKNNNNENLFDLLSKLNGGAGLFTNHHDNAYFKKLPENLKPLLLDITHYFYINKECVTLNTTNKDIRDLLTFYNYTKLNEQVGNKETSIIKRNKL